MPQFIQYHLPDGASVFIEAPPDESSGSRPVGVGKKVIDSTKQIKEVFGSLGHLVKEIKDSVQEKMEDAEEVTVEFGVNVSGDVNLFIARSQVEANFKVTVSWKK